MPTSAQADRLMQHLRWSERSYTQWLNGSTFRIATERPAVYRALHPLRHYREQFESGVPEATAELLRYYGFNRFTAPYIFLMVFVNPRDRFPVGVGRPFNGGYNTGGGIAVLSTHLLDSLANFQSTLEHELGHSFGLPHVDVYGYDMERNTSIMSYNQDHLTDRFNAAPNPGNLIAEDIRGLALNRRVFSGRGIESMAASVSDSAMPNPVWLGPMEIPGEHPYSVRVTTKSGETWASSVQNIVVGEIRENNGPGVTYDARTMWTSGETTSGWVTVDVTFPLPVGLTRVIVHSEHSGLYHAAHAVRIATVDELSGATSIVEQELAASDASVEFVRHESRTWRFDFRPGESGMVVIRGLEFFDGESAVFPPLVPYRPGNN